MLTTGFRRQFLIRFHRYCSTSLGEAKSSRQERFEAHKEVKTTDRAPLGDQKTLYLRHQKHKMRSSGDTRFGAYNQGFGSYSNTYSGPGYGGGPAGGFGVSGYGGASRAFGAGGFPGQGLREVPYNTQELAKIDKDFYTESPAVTQRSGEELQGWIENNQVTLSGKNIPRPVFNFDEAGFTPEIERSLLQNYQQPTVIQSISWPVAMSGRDIVSIAKTGSGKTLGFLLPAIMHILRQERRSPRGGPGALVMLPTRELAQQVEEVARVYCPLMGLDVTCLFGGAPKTSQLNDLRRGVDIVIATPGRLLDFLEAGATNMQRCSYLVLDEADRMLDMGFEPQIRKIVGQIRPDRQTLMFSATWPREVRTLAMDFQTEPVFLNVGSLELSANHNITQYVEVVQEYSKPQRLFQVLTQIAQEKENKTLIFTQTKRKADDLTSAMRRDGWPALCIHGDKSQGERDWVMSEFKTGNAPILLATDVASRGLDVSDIKFVINYDYPNNSEDYVHRIGRTGRRDNKGTAYTFFTQTDAPKAKDLIKVLEEASQNVPDELREMGSGGGSFKSSFGRRPGPPSGGGGYGGGYGSGGNRGYGGGGYGGRY
ncbi:unnamed protein product [Bursaphelenchus okinawaensis]|uniref:RNA helicase n=1 Tax=Bursaphelenchus okinawaensis TaxID=465554 RepID=A0A811L6W0_9BILA|nr:unnamed protein product [Bursaphelenchus okinawaensis]CAG9118969.1 unnamed protein product [Bursaphelenchus okinawaensis]